ncbi:MAG: hypothetical protein H0X25_08085 [Acidobacteriales bacterium]|nr:hypothetical protein [Terriglobales bacterium]
MKKVAEFLRAHRLLLGILAAILMAAAVGLYELDAHISPILKAHAIDALSERFDSEVQIEYLHASLFRVRIDGGGIAIRHHGRTDVPPLIEIKKFYADASILDILRKRWSINKVRLDGLAINIPPKELRQPSTGGKKHPDIPVHIDELLSVETQLTLLPGKPGKLPHVYGIHRLVMRGLGKGEAAEFHTTLRNAVPPGDIKADGTFGPWDREDPGSTPVSADYIFNDANLGVFRGLAGILSSKGKFGGPLNELAVEGQTVTPDFTVKVGGHPMKLTTEFQATVDGTNGETFLHPVTAHFLNSTIVANGGVVKGPPGMGREVKLQVTAKQAHLEDLMKFAVKADPPPMTGLIDLDTQFDLPPGPDDIAQRLALDGKFTVQQGHFTKTSIQEKLRTLSARGQGKADEVEGGSDVTQLAGRFSLGRGLLAFRELTFRVEGVRVQLHGTFSLTNEAIEMHGHAYMNAKLSQMTKGYKSWLLKPVDPFFRKNGVTVIPIKITGTRDKPDFGLDL